TYDGSTLSETIRDTVTGATFTHDYSNLAIPNLVGSHVDYVGFTGATSEVASVQDVQTWTADFGPPSNPTPTLASLSTTPALEGSTALTLTLNGSNFVSNSTAQWNGTNLTTTFVSANQLTAVVPASLLAEEGTAAITVSNPGGGSSGAQNFSVQ